MKIQPNCRDRPGPHGSSHYEGSRHLMSQFVDNHRLSVTRKLPKKSFFFRKMFKLENPPVSNNLKKKIREWRPPLKQGKMIELHIATGLCSGRWWWWFSWILLWYTSRRESVGKIRVSGLSDVGGAKNISRSFQASKRGWCFSNPRYVCSSFFQVQEINQNWVVFSNMFYVHYYLGKIPILTTIFQRGWNHQSEKCPSYSSLLWGVRLLPRYAEENQENPSRSSPLDPIRSVGYCLLLENGWDPMCFFP